MAEHDRFARSLLAVARGLTRLGRERARSEEVTPQQAETLQLIAERGALSTSTLAHMLGIDPSTASRNLAGLERAGYLSRRKGTDDARQTDVRLTPRGRRAAEHISTASSQAYATLVERLPKGDRGKVIDALDTLARILDGASDRSA
jgi:DNA-binding MarR family transcriptional regulator